MKKQFVKGKSGNVKGRPKKNKVSYSFSQAPSEGGGKSSLMGSSDEWVNFGDDNMFPSAVAQLGRKSPNHRSILAFKSIYVSGESITSEDERTQNYIEEINNRQETLKDVLDKEIRDYNEGGNAYLELVKEGGAVNMFHKDWTKARLKKDGKAVLFHPNWSKVKQEPEKIIEIPLYPEFANVEGKQRSIVHFKCYEPEWSHYGLPTWIAAMDAAAIGYKTNKWNVSRLDNSFASSGVLVVEGDMSEGDAAKMQADFKKEFTGADNQGKVMMIIKQLGGGGSTFTPITAGTEGDWINLHKQSTDDLVMAHLWFRSLSGIADSTGFETNRIRTEHEEAHNVIIPQIRNKFMRKISMIIKEELGFDPVFEIKNIPSVSLLDKLNINAITRIWEGRQIAGLDADKTDPEQQGYIEVKKDGTTNNSSRGNNDSNN